MTAAEATMAEEPGPEEEEDHKARYPQKNIFIKEHSARGGGYASVAAMSLPGPMVDRAFRLTSLAFPP